MKLLFIIIEWLASASESAGFLILMHALYEARFPKRKQLLYCGVFCGLLGTGTLLLNLFDLSVNMITMTYTCIAFWLIAAITYRGKLLEFFLMSFGYMGFLAAIDLIWVTSAFALGMQEEQFMAFGVQRMAVVIIGKTGNLLIVCLIAKILKKLGSYLKESKTLAVTVTALVAGAVGLYFYIRQFIAFYYIRFSTFQTVFGISVTLAMAVVYLLFRVREIQLERSYTLRQNEILERNYITAKESYESNAKLYHDMRNHFAMLQGYLKEENVAEARDYLENLSGNKALYSATAYTGLGAIDYILEQKKEKTETLGIWMDIHAEYPKDCGIDPVDLCTILTNLIDNAIEACVKQTKGEAREIHVTIRRVNQFILIRIQNSSSTAPVIRDGALVTSKKDKRLHGWGMKSVQTAVEKYQGVIEYEYENQMMTVSVMMFIA